MVDIWDCSNEEGLHCHECPKCKAVWQHPDNSRHMGAHCCPRCGTDQHWKMFLSEVTNIDFKWELPKHDHTIGTRIACYSCGSTPRY